MKKREPVASPNISTFREVVPYIYSWMTPDIPKYDGWEKIGYTEQESAEKRIAQQAGQLNIQKIKVWAYRAAFMTEDGGTFRDSDFHAFLKQQGIEREFDPTSTPSRTEWHKFAGAPKPSQQYFFEFASKSFATPHGPSQDDYTLRPEQQHAVSQAIEAFGSHCASEVLWNAKPRFGKTLTTYDLMLKMDVKRVLIVTNRPAIANSWFDDYQRFIGHKTTYQFVSDSPSLAQRNPMTREQWRAYLLENVDRDPRIIEFVSLQDLKGSKYFGGSFDKLKHIADFNWDLLVIDEAHEGIDTTRTDVVFTHIKRSHTLHLSGTPFKALASGRFSANQIFNWTYEDEQNAKASWTDASIDNPYAQLPTLNLLTYQLSRMVTDRLAEGVALDEDAGNVDYTFDLAEFFATKDNGYFVYEGDVARFLDALTTQEKYPFSTPELRDEIRHSFWLLNRVASAKALERMLKKHPVFGDYTVILAAGDGRPHADESDGLDEDGDDSVSVGKSLDKVRSAIKKAEAEGGKTITLSVGQLTTGVTVPEWTAPGLFDEAVFNQAIQEFFDKKDELSDYFDPALTEDIFAYIPQQKTSLVFTPKPVVQLMCDRLEEANPGIFSDPDRTFADLFSTAGLFLMEIVRRLDKGLANSIPDQNDRLRHILTQQVFEMGHNEILHAITLEAVSGGVPERRAWLQDSGHFRVGDLARMTADERERVVAEMLGDK